VTTNGRDSPLSGNDIFTYVPPSWAVTVSSNGSSSTPEGATVTYTINVKNNGIFDQALKFVSGTTPGIMTVKSPNPYLPPATFTISQTSNTATWTSPGCLTMAKNVSQDFKFDAILDCGGWLAQTAASAQGGNALCSFMVDATALDAGFTPEAHVLSVSPTSLSFTAVCGSFPISSLPLTIKNNTSNPSLLKWELQSIAYGSRWNFGLSLSLGGNSLGLGANQSNTTDVWNSNSLVAPGIYTATISIKDSDGCVTEQDVPVTYTVSPSVTLIPLNYGSATGYEAISVQGTGFTNASSVTFGGTPAVSFTVNWDNYITVTTPPHSAGTVDIVVTTNGQASPISLFDRFTFQ
jgi:hypothetical protein